MGVCSAAMLMCLFMCLAVYCFMKTREGENRLHWWAHFSLSLFVMVCSATITGFLFKESGVLGRHFVATLLLFAAGGVVQAGTVYVGVRAFVTMDAPLAWLRLVGAATMIIAACHVLMTMLSYTVDSASPFDGAIATLEAVVGDATIVATLIALVWFIVEHPWPRGYVDAALAWWEKKRSRDS